MHPELRASLEQSRRWRDSGGSEGQPLYLAFEQAPNVQLSGAVLFEAVLQEADLRGAHLDGVDASASNASGVCLAHADLRSSNWTKANLQQADLSGANLEGARLVRTDLGRSLLRGANLRSCDLRRALCGGVDLSGACLEGANLTETRLGRANLSNADLTDAVLDGCVFDASSRFAGATGIASASISHIFLVEGGHLDAAQARAWLAARTGVEPES